MPMTEPDRLIRRRRAKPAAIRPTNIMLMIRVPAYGSSPEEFAQHEYLPTELAEDYTPEQIAALARGETVRRDHKWYGYTETVSLTALGMKALAPTVVGNDGQPIRVTVPGRD